ncbi:LacI family DNA-binding transcriptional regulator [Flavisolibacter nicotianae]|uniref:LacI family DNA-binding transcriptional regulator n=1 Tax=Flavisolibacter nicotianae TaxID=2364882 RepID=UPI000EB1B4DA|nr:LacI family DNA-binding transcriptional regulator [Flavisolibacter nicotianae]
MRKVSIKDIAMKAGVVPSTVSLVLNGKSKQMRISDELAEKIKAIAEQTGYIPNQTAVSLRTGRSKILGLIVEDISNVFFASLAKVIEDEVNSLGYKIVYCSTDNNDEKGRELIKVLLHRQVDGFLITPSTGMMNEVKRLVELKKPVVLMDRFFPQLNNSYVLVDNFSGVQQGVEYLVQKGHRNIAYITNDLDQNQMHERERAYRDILKKHKLPVSEAQILRLPYEIKSEEAVAKMTEFLRSSPQLDAAFFATNYLGVYGLESIQQLGYQIPRDLAIVCFDDHALFRLMAPGITCIRQPIEAIATTAVNFLLQQFADTVPPPEQLQELKKPTLVIRGSV